MTAAVTPIAAADIAEVGRFLHENLNSKIPADTWIASFAHAWAESPPNHGMQLRDDGRLVGVFCAIYSDQWIDGRLERFCNPHSWCVLNEYRGQSIGLILPLLKQRGYHFTMYTPNPKVAEVFRGLKFRNLSDGLLYFPNLPRLRAMGRDEFVEADPGRIPARLPDHMRRDFEQHRDIPWLRFVAFGRDDDPCLVAYKPDSVKGIPCARLLHVSDTGALARHGGLLGQYLLLSERMPASRVEARFLERAPRFALRRLRGQPKLVLSKSLVDAQFHDLYSELVALDI